MKKAVLLLLVTLLIATSVQAVEVSLKDSETGTTIADKIISINIEGRESTKQISSLGKISLPITEGQTIELTVDNPETQGKDYYSKIIYDGESEILLFQISSIRGIVKDSLDNIVSYSDIKFACKPLPKINHPSNADRFGTFSTITPTGKCKIYASYEDALGFKEIVLEQGELRDIEIRLDKTIVSFPVKTYTGWIVAIVLAITIFAGAAYLMLRKKAPKENKKETTKSKDILPTLSTKEKEIVNYIELNKGKALQAQIRHNTGIPRTTLARIIKGLEEKNILRVRKEGKAVKIKLTDWFLGKE
ncbi:hypothetical protein GF343_00540 [Candidatus Woesearchaeota archaeon]|nr:hypothetical protein [Candidatus Woesearchaeota archaeon]